MIEVGDKAPGFTLENDAGRVVRMQDWKGKMVVLYFYPKDDTSGCTTEACGFRDLWAEIQATGAVVLGVSPDSATSHARFRDKYTLPFPLLADPDHTLAEAYGVWGEKSMYGRTYFGIHRTTFVIGPDGRVRSVFRKVKPKGHAAEVLAALQT